MPKTILLADDSVTIRRVVELTFSDTGIRVESVDNGRDALDRIDRVEPDLVLADVAMPEPSGYAICEKVKSSSRPVPVLLLAGTFEPFDAERARACGADGHVVKPFESSTLLSRVQSLLERPPAPSADTAPAAELDAVFDDLAAEGGPERTAEADETPSVDRSRRSGAPAAGGSLALPSGAVLTGEDVDALVREIARRLSAEVVREIAWDVVPDLAEMIIRERIRELERDVEG